VTARTLTAPELAARIGRTNTWAVAALADLEKAGLATCEDGYRWRLSLGAELEFGMALRDFPQMRHVVRDSRRYIPIDAEDACLSAA
jgi:hypothetical protein